MTKDAVSIERLISNIYTSSVDRRLSNSIEVLKNRKMPTLVVLSGLSVADEGDFSVKQAQFKQTNSSCAFTKRPDILENVNIYDGKWGYAGSTEVTSIYQGRFHACRRRRPRVQRDLQRLHHDRKWPLLLIGDYLSDEPSRPMVHQVIFDFTRLPEANVRFERILQSGDSLKPGKKVILSDRKVLSDQLRAVSGRQRI